MRPNAPRPFEGLSHLRVSLALRAARPINDKPMRIDDCRTMLGGCVDPREKFVFVPVCQDFLNGHRTLYAPMVSPPLRPSPSKSAVSKYGKGSTSCEVVSRRDVIVIAPAFLEL